MVKNHEREKLVRKLGKQAVKCGLEAIDQQSSRKTVKKLVASIKSSVFQMSRDTALVYVSAAMSTLTLTLKW